MGHIDILPKESIKIEEIDSIPYYPAISFDEAQKKVENSIANISKNQGVESSEFFKGIFNSKKFVECVSPMSMS
jgi:hypothetical protein